MQKQLTAAAEKPEVPIVTDGALKLIDRIVKERNLTNRIDILEAVCEDMERRWGQKALEHRLSQMSLQTTSRILYAIDLYLVGTKHKLLA